MIVVFSRVFNLSGVKQKPTSRPSLFSVFSSFCNCKYREKRSQGCLPLNLEFFQLILKVSIKVSIK